MVKSNVILISVYALLACVLIPLLDIRKEDLGLGPFCTVEPWFRIFIEIKLPICTQEIVRNTMFYRYITVLHYSTLNFSFC